MKSPVGARRRIGEAWSDLGWGGRIALAVIVSSIAVGVGLGLELPRSAQHHLLDGRAGALQTVGQALADDASHLVDPTRPEGLSDFDAVVRTRLLGGETIGAKLWAADGTILYASDLDLVGQRIPLPSGAVAALKGHFSHAIVDHDSTDGASPSIRLIEYFLPVTGADEMPYAAFEVEQRTGSLDAAVGRISTTVWTSIGLGLGLLLLFLSSVVLATARGVARRRQHTERLLGQTLVAQETERKRIVAALHSDIGQRLYRVLYGLEGAQRRADDPEAVAAELKRLEDLVRNIDKTLRSELRMLHRDAVHEIGFAATLRELAEMTRLESDLEVEVINDVDQPVPAELGGLLVWAAEEAIINARKHASASTVSIRADADVHRIAIEVNDDGTGFETSRRGIGLTTLAERLSLAGGGMDIRSRRGHGTLLRAWIETHDRGEE